MPTLRLRLTGPMQSWGSQSNFDQRDTEYEPTKSGVLGLLCAALGIDRENWADLEPMTNWRMGVRTVAPGILRKDYQTAQLHPHKAKTDTAQSWRHYLADADFVVGLESHDRAALECALQALRNPHWPLFLGRKSYPPSRPIFSAGLLDLPLQEALQHPVDDDHPGGRLAIESQGSEGSERWDVPASSFAQRRYRPRRVYYV